SSLFLNIAGSYNTASGYYSLGWNATGNSNTAMGDHSLAVNRTGSYNTAQGAYSLFYNTAGLNTAIGYKSMYWNTSGYSNTAAGSYSLNLNKTGSYNTGFGQYSLFNTTGSWNTAFGANSLQTNATGFANTALGDGADVSAGGLSNAMALGYKAVVNASNKVAIGNSSVSVIGGQVGWSTFSDGRFKTNIHENVPGLAFINKLKPVTYNLELKKFDQFLGKTQSEISSMQVEYFAGEKKVRTGFIAQDVEKSAQELHFDFDGVNHPQDSKDNYSLVYADFVPSLVKAVQELSAQNEAQSAEILQMKDEITRLKGTKIINAVNEDAAVASDKALLGQNQPNPFGSQTIIPVKLPQYFSNALVVVTETATGRMLKTITVAPGATQLTFSANSFAAGSFTYSLYVDGKRIDTKQMVHAVTK
ncbi:MAG TPA: tail fiber domain-containing protein, partial [Panacibacter sp.]|nr:tail fiber domain-containing protein [Panacibacter sp.]